MIESEKIALIYAFDIPHYVKLANNIREYRFYDEELLKSVKYWRKNAGNLKDISINALTFGDIQCYNTDVIQKLKLLNVNIYNTNVNFTDDLSWLKCVYAGKFFEEQLNQDFLIRLDLDMYCLKALPEKWFQLANDNILVGSYDIRNNLESRQIYYNNTTFDISLIISNKKFDFYNKYYNFYCDKKTFDTDEWKLYTAKCEKYFPGYIGEYVIDYMNNNNVVPIHPITNHYFGEGYRDISLYTNDEAKQICFLHEHIRKNSAYYDDYNPIKSMLTYMYKIKNV